MNDPVLIERFRSALADERLRLVYQPKICLQDGGLQRVEALVRWDDPDWGPVPPSRFVPLAEQSGLIGVLTDWGLRTALAQWQSWAEQGLDISIAFNMSALSLGQLDFPDKVEALCQQYGVPADRLVLELTEGATQPLINLMDTLTRFRIKGIGLAIDDFGTGYSSLLQLRSLPFTEVKIDRAFVSDMCTADDSLLIVRTIVDLVHGLGLTATAEGLENTEQLQLLRHIGCDLAQGYLISPPIEPDQLISWSAAFRERWQGMNDLPPALPFP